MMMMQRIATDHRLVLILLVLCTALAGCLRPLGGSGGPPPDYYVMTAEPPQPGLENDTRPRGGPIVGVAPVRLAAHLQHGEIVTRSSSNQVVLADLHRWAAPLDNQISRLLALNLSTMIPTDRVIVLPASRAVPLDYRVEMEAALFERLAGGDVELIATWQLFRGDEGRLLTMRKSTIRQPVTGSGYQAIVDAMSKALADLSGQIATEIRTGS